jgi:predicted phage tail protein
MAEAKGTSRGGTDSSGTFGYTLKCVGNVPTFTNIKKTPIRITDGDKRLQARLVKRGATLPFTWQNGWRVVYQPFVPGRVLTLDEGRERPMNICGWTLPSAPRTLKARAGNATVNLLWVAPRRNGGTPVTDYHIQRSLDGRTWTAVRDGVSTATRAHITHLHNGTTYQFRVVAQTAAGMGNKSLIVHAKPLTVPSAPSMRVTRVGSHRVSLAWDAPARNGGAPIRRYVVQQSTHRTSGFKAVRVTEKRTMVIAGLRNNTRYFFRVRAINVAGAGAFSAVLGATPSAPSIASTVHAV